MTLRNETEYITLTLGKKYDDCWEDYELTIDAEVSFVTVRSMQTYAQKSAFQELYTKLSEATSSVSGEVFMEQFSYEAGLYFRITYDGLGHAVVEANLCKNDNGNACTLRLETDQTYISDFLKQLKREVGL